MEFNRFEGYVAGLSAKIISVQVPLRNHWSYNSNSHTTANIEIRGQKFMSRIHRDLDWDTNNYIRVVIKKDPKIDEPLKSNIAFESV